MKHYQLVISKAPNGLFVVNHGDTRIGYYLEFRIARMVALDMCKLLNKLAPDTVDPFLVPVHHTAWQDFLDYCKGHEGFTVESKKVGDEALGIEQIKPEPAEEEFGC